MPQPVLERVIDHLRLETAIGGYESAEFMREQLDNTYTSIANLIGANSDEIALVENATRAWDMAFYAINFQPGDRILTAKSEYFSNYIAYLQVAKKTGAIIDVIPNDEHGQVSVAALREMVDERVKLISISHIPTNGGLVQPAAEIGKIAKAHNILYLLDACQSVGQMPLDVEELGCDMLSATGRKYLRAPRGTGFLYVRQSILDQLEPPLLDGQAATWTSTNQYEMKPNAKRFENWERNIAGILGLGAAVDYAQALGLDVIWARVHALAEQLREQLAAIPAVTMRDLGQLRCGIVTFTVQGMDVAELKMALRAQKINVSKTTLFSTRLDMEARELSEMVRASVHYYNNAEEIGRFCQTVKAIITTQK